MTDLREPETGAPGLTVSDLTIRYGDTEAVRGVSVQVRPDETVAVVGPSGCGKSSTLRAVAGLTPVAGGAIGLGGRDITHLDPARRGVGLVPQDYAVFPHMSVAGNIAYGLRARRLPADRRRRRVAEMLELTRLTELAGRRPGQLSGGQRQRVALARALAVEPDVLLLDEPLAALDPQLRGGLRRELSAMLSSSGCATLIVTHDQREALSLGTRIALMREGTLVQFGTPENSGRTPPTPSSRTSWPARSCWRRSAPRTVPRCSTGGGGSRRRTWGRDRPATAAHASSCATTASPSPTATTGPR
ncbi:ABC transporter ATP-binding protein [Nocardiopsis sp. ARC36]